MHVKRRECDNCGELAQCRFQAATSEWQCRPCLVEGLAHGHANAGHEQLVEDCPLCFSEAAMEVVACLTDDLEIGAEIAQHLSEHGYGGLGIALEALAGAAGKPLPMAGS